MAWASGGNCLTISNPCFHSAETRKRQKPQNKTVFLDRVTPEERYTLKNRHRQLATKNSVGKRNTSGFGFPNTRLKLSKLSLSGSQNLYARRGNLLWAHG